MPCSPLELYPPILVHNSLQNHADQRCSMPRYRMQVYTSIQPQVLERTKKNLKLVRPSLESRIVRFVDPRDALRLGVELKKTFVYRCFVMLERYESVIISSEGS